MDIRQATSFTLVTKDHTLGEAIDIKIYPQKYHILAGLFKHSNINNSHA